MFDCEYGGAQQEMEITLGEIQDLIPGGYSDVPEVTVDPGTGKMRVKITISIGSTTDLTSAVDHAKRVLSRRGYSPHDEVLSGAA